MQRAGVTFAEREKGCEAFCLDSWSGGQGAGVCRSSPPAGLDISHCVPLIPAACSADSPLSSARVCPMSKVFLRQGLRERPKEGGPVPGQGGKAMLGAFLRNLHLPTPHPQGSLQACRKQVAVPRAPDGLWGWQWERGSHFAMRRTGWLQEPRDASVLRVILRTGVSLMNAFFP